MDKTDARPLHGSKSSSATKQKYPAEETKKKTSYPVQESSLQESASASGLSSLGDRDSGVFLRSGSQNDSRLLPTPANSMGSMGDSGFGGLVVEFLFLFLCASYIYKWLGFK